MNAKEKLLALAAQLPPDLRSDWKGTNHFELTTCTKPSGGYWWLDLDEIEAAIVKFRGQGSFLDEEETGKKLGLLFDLAEAAAAFLAEEKKQ